MTKALTWIVAADGGRARFFERLRPGVKLTELKALAMSAEPLAPTKQRPARVYDRMGPARHAVEPRATPKEAAETRFLGEVADAINQAAAQGAFEKLILCAPPRAAGILGKCLSGAARKRLTAAVNKDLVRARPEEMAERLGELLRQADARLD